MKLGDTIPDAAGGEGGHGVARPDVRWRKTTQCLRR
jgi:hypothetical protein